MSRSSGRLAALVAVVAILLAACANQDVDGKDAASVLLDAGAPKAVSTCVGDRIDDELSQKQKNTVGKADQLSDLNNDLQDTVQGILDECVSGDGADSGSDSSSTDEGDTSDTTEAGDSTTTSAPG
jgi:predicted small secreted protein